MQTEPQTPLVPQPQPEPQAVVQQHTAAVADAPTQAPNGNGSLDRLLNAQPNLALQPAPVSQLPTVVEAKPLLPTIQQHQSRRKGRIAQLPKIHRDLVNRMLHNGVPYKNIVAALERLGYLVKERNISNWANGGYLDWKLEQEIITQNRLDQDHLVDNLRREDASDLAEVGLQAAATRLSQTVVQKLANAEDIEANLPKFSQMVGMLRGITRDLAATQKQRDDARKTLGPAYDVNRVKNEEQKAIRELEDDFSYPEHPKKRGLGLPADFPFLPPVPMSQMLEEADQYITKRRHQKIMALFGATDQKTSTAPAPAPPPAPNGQPPTAQPGPPASRNDAHP